MELGTLVTNLETIFEDETAPHYGANVIAVSSELKSAHLFASTTSGTGAVNADLEASNDGSNWFWVGNLTIATVTTAGVSVAVSVTNAFRFHRINMYGISGTGCKATAIISHMD